MTDSVSLEHIDVFTAGHDGVHTYRIPSLLAVPGGALLAFCEARKISGSDASPTDMVMKRSADGGRTWLPMQALLHGEGSEAFMNPCPITDGATVLLFCMEAHRKAKQRHRHLLLRSADGGQTWSRPVELDQSIAAYDDTFIPGPGVGIRMRSGRLVVPGYSNELGPDGVRLACWSRVLYSDDGGGSWRLGQPAAFPWSCESQVVELTDGILMLNWRVQRPPAEHPGCRGVAISRDGGETWTGPRLAPELNEAPCQAGFLRYASAERGKRSMLLFSNPDASRGPEGGARKKMTIRLSCDDGLTWPNARLIHAGPAAYSCPAVLPDGMIALLYECGEARAYERIRLARFGLEWLTNGSQRLV